MLSSVVDDDGCHHPRPRAIEGDRPKEHSAARWPSPDRAHRQGSPGGSRGRPGRRLDGRCGHRRDRATRRRGGAVLRPAELAHRRRTHHRRHPPRRGRARDLRRSDRSVLTLQPTSPFRTARHIERRSTAAVHRGRLGRLGRNPRDADLGHRPPDGRPIPVAARPMETSGVKHRHPPSGSPAESTSPRVACSTTGRLVDDRPAALVLDPVASIDVDTMDDLRMARRVARQRAPGMKRRPSLLVRHRHSS